jgi:hypothetical protein
VARRAATLIPAKLSRVSQRLESKLAGAPKVKQRTSDLDVLYREAADADAVLQKTTRELASELGGEAQFPPGLKGRERALEKIASKYGGDAAGLTDISRATIQFDRLEDVYDALGELEGRGIEIVRLNDRFLKPTAEGYRDIITNVRMPNGHVAELQLHVKGVLKAKDVNHVLYERQRSIVARAKIAGRDLTALERQTIDSLVAQQQATYSEAFRASLSKSTAVKPRASLPKSVIPPEPRTPSPRG